VTGGTNGTTSSTSLTEFLPNGATSGGVGTITTFSAASIVGGVTANAGADGVFCRNKNMNASLNANSYGTWSVISGSGGSFVNVNDPFTVFSGDSSQNYKLLWSVVNNLCQLSKDTLNLAPICQPLPVKMLEFTAKAVDGVVILDWSTAMEENLNYFVIEKSTDHINWQEMSVMHTNGNSYSIRHYQTIDQQAFGKIIYYRIKQVFLNLSFDYSDIINVELTFKKGIYLLYPMPVVNTLTIEGGQENSGASVSIYNHLGQEIEIWPQFINENIMIDLSHIKHGIYVVKVLRGNEILYTQTISKM